MRKPDVHRFLRAQSNAALRTAALLAGLWLLAANGCDGSTAPNLHVARVEVNLAAPTLLIGTTAVATARAFDLNGAQITGATANWASSNASIVSVDSKTGVLTGNALGSATITATIGGVNGTANITVVPLPVASVEISPNGGALPRGQSLQLRTTVRDQFGDTLTDRTVNWTSSAPGIAQVTSSGLVNAIAAGTAVVTATAEDQSDAVTMSVVVTPVPGGPAILTISPSLLTPGATATITGTNFGATPGLNEVRIAGVPAPIQSASTTEIVIQVPTTGFGCEPTRQVYVQVVSTSAADAKLAAIQVAPQKVLQPGETQILSSAADARCFELAPTGGRYLVSVYNTGTQVASTAGFRLRGARGLLPPGIVQPEPKPANPRALARAVVRVVAPAQVAGLLSRAADRAADAAHARLLEANINYLRAHRAELQANALRPRAALRTASININQPIGTVLQLRIPNVGGFGSGGLGFCSDNFAVNARIVYSGTRAVIVEDVTAPLANQMDTLFQKVGQEFDGVMFDVAKNNFGDPLRMDDLLEGNGKILMLYSPKINTFSNIAGFVVTCDFFTTQQAPSSNHTEVFYARVPTDPSAGFDNPVTHAPLDTRARWYWSARSTIIHEVKHIATFATRIRDFGQSFEEGWLEEGLARHAEEIWARTAAYNGLAQGANAAYANTVFCDVRPQGPAQCIGKPYALIRHFGEAGLYDFMADNELRSPLGSKLNATEGSYYGTAWSLVRWALDNHQVDEAGFLTSLVHSSQSGVANLTTRLGRPWEEILGEWSLALYLDDYPGFVPANARIRFPSWNLRSIYQGLHNDFCEPASCTNFPRDFPLVPRTANYGDFSVTVPSVAGGTFSMFLLTANQSNRQLLQLLGATVAAADPLLRVAIARID